MNSPLISRRASTGSGAASAAAPGCQGEGRHDRWRDEAVAAGYDARRFGGLAGHVKAARDRALLARILGVEPKLRRVLDLPAGTGRLLESLSGKGRWVVGADRSLEMLRAGRSEMGGPEHESPPSIPRLQADARRLPFKDDAFDAVVSMRFLFHLSSRDERVGVLREMSRVATKLVVVQVRSRANAKQAGRWLRSRVGLSKRWSPAPSRSALRTELEAAGLLWVTAIPVSRVLSDKVLLVARPGQGGSSAT